MYHPQLIVLYTSLSESRMFCILPIDRDLAFGTSEKSPALKRKLMKGP